jgi:mannosylglycerate hydrolase
MARSKYTTFLLIAHTHWDREWYRPFEEFRLQLVVLVDRLTDILRSQPEFKFFTLDGQSILIEDYLDARPERQDELRDLIQTGRISTGPWYAMPDEFLVSGESLVRNLLRGTRLAQSFGQTMRVGYLPDPFGHIAQLPQILRGFEIDTAVLWRGIGGDVDTSEFVWSALDGTTVDVIYLPHGYNNAARLPGDDGAAHDRLLEIQADLAPWATTDMVVLMHGDDHLEPQSDLPQIIERANRRLKNGEIRQATLEDAARALRDRASELDSTWPRHTGEFRSPEYAHLLAGVLSARLWIKQRNFACEQLLERWAEPFTVFAGWARPDLASKPGVHIGAGARPALQIAWRHLLRNHFHDSICGCSVDQVHDEMQTRFSGCEQVGTRLVENALSTVAKSINTAGLNGPRGETAETFLVLFNAESGPRTDYLEVEVRPPAGAMDFILVDTNGVVLPHRVLSESGSEMMRLTVPREQLKQMLRLAGPGGGWPVWKLKILERLVSTLARGHLPQVYVQDILITPVSSGRAAQVRVDVTDYGGHNYDAVGRGLREISALVSRGDVGEFVIELHGRGVMRVGVVARDVPPVGYSTFRVLPGHRARTGEPSLRRDTTMQNEFFSIHADEATGGLTIIDKETGAVHAAANTFSDGGDAGDAYTYSPPIEDRIVYGPIRSPEITLLDESPARTSLLIQMALRLPAGLTPDRQSRSDEMVDCPLTTEVSIYPGVRRIDVRTVIDNQARDHRLRVHFPVHVRAENSHAGTQFGVIDRPVVQPVAGVEWRENPVSTFPQTRFADISDGEAGFALAARGLPEYDAVAIADGVDLSLTLLRCIGWLSRDDLATRRGGAGPTIAVPGAQGLGQHTFEYSLIPHPGDWTHVASLADWFASPLRALITDSHAGTLPAKLSLVNVSPPGIVLSAVKPAEDGDGVIARLFNPLTRDVEVHLSFGLRVGQACRTSLSETDGERIELTGDRELRMHVRAGEIASVRLWPE